MYPFNVCFPLALLRGSLLRISLTAARLIVGNAIDAETQCGPLIRNEVDRVENGLQKLLMRC